MLLAAVASQCLQGGELLVPTPSWDLSLDLGMDSRRGAVRRNDEWSLVDSGQRGARDIVESPLPVRPAGLDGSPGSELRMHARASGMVCEEALIKYGMPNLSLF